MKSVHDGLGVNSMSDLVLKEKRCMKYERSMKEKILQIMKLKNIEWLEDKFLKNIIILVKMTG